jgi:hypothetical protein
MAYTDGKWTCSCGALDHYSCLCPPFAARTPVEIDTRINELDYRYAGMIAQHNAAESVMTRKHTPATAAAALRTLDELAPKIDANREERGKLEAEYERRGTWSRAYVVPGGHVHRDYDCHTLYRTTVRFLAAEVSGFNETQVVEAAGERACTVCYPSAPVDVLKRATRIFTPDEQETADARAAKERKQAEREAATLTVTLVDDLTGKTCPQTFRTVRAARNEALSEYGWALYGVAYYGETNPNTIVRGRIRLHNVETLAAAIAEREGAAIETVREELTNKGRAKFNREAKSGMNKRMTAKEKTAEAERLLDEALARLA